MTAAAPVAPVSPPQPPRLLDQFRSAARVAGQPERWIEPLTSWVTAYILIFHGKRHPCELDPAARDAFLRRQGRFSNSSGFHAVPHPTPAPLRNQGRGRRLQRLARQPTRTAKPFSPFLLRVTSSARCAREGTP
jgi:hypothetical protein